MKESSLNFLLFSSTMYWFWKEETYINGFDDSSLQQTRRKQVSYIWPSFIIHFNYGKEFITK